MKIATVLGTRPEIIRLPIIIAKLGSLCEHVLIHTGQNFDRALSDVFFEEMGIRAPDHFLGVRGDTPAAQIGQILERCERIFLDHRPDRLLILGDTNSALCAIVAKRMGIPVFHMEAGNRCYDDRVREVNRRRSTTPPTPDALHGTVPREFAARGLRPACHVTGNPIREVSSGITTTSTIPMSSIGSRLSRTVTFATCPGRNVDVATPQRFHGGAGND